jgi:hypothetical protein
MRARSLMAASMFAAAASAFMPPLQPPASRLPSRSALCTFSHSGTTARFRASARRSAAGAESLRSAGSLRLCMQKTPGSDKKEEELYAEVGVRHLAPLPLAPVSGPGAHAPTRDPGARAQALQTVLLAVGASTAFGAGVWVTMGGQAGVEFFSGCLSSRASPSPPRLHSGATRDAAEALRIFP